MKSTMTGSSTREVEPWILVTEMKVPPSMTVNLHIGSKSFELTAEDWNFILDAARKGMTPAPCMPAPCMPAPPPPPAPPRKCLVDGCKNHSNQGKFIGDLCMPCHDMLTTGKLRGGATFIHNMQARLHKIIDIAT
jgi:hypothetical protein